MLSTLIGLVLGGVYYSIYRLLKNDRIPVSWAHPIAAIVLLFGYLVLPIDLATGGQQSDDLRFVGLALILISTGTLFLRLRWYLGMTAFIFATWTGVSIAVGIDIGWGRHAAVLLLTTMAAFNSFASRKQAILRMIDVQIDNDLQNLQLMEARTGPPFRGGTEG
ncbi:MAG: hypothetical protein R3A46_17160 [Thermomicrobiales bacterium]